MWLMFGLTTLAFATDADGDGFDSVATGGMDCDDTNAAVNPGMPESCEVGVQVDTDCDGNPNTQGGMYATSEDTLFENMSASLPYYIDADADGFADMYSTDPIYLCRPGDAERFYATIHTDCDDHISDTYPGAPEMCNYVDDNCNGIIDDLQPGTDPPPSAVEVFLDEDGDDYGEALDPPLFMCRGFILERDSEPDEPGFEYLGSRYSQTGGDCDDDDDRRHPRPADYVEEVDGHDNDCDGRVSLRELDCDQDGACPLAPDVDCTNRPPSPLVTCGRAVFEARCSQDSGEWLVLTDRLPDLYIDGRRINTLACSTGADDCDDNDAERSFDAAEVCDGFDTSCAGTEGLSIDEDDDGVSDALQGGIAGRTQEQLLDVDDDGLIDACDDLGPEHLVVGSGPEYPAPSDEPDIDEDTDADTDDEAIPSEPSGCTCSASSVSPAWGLMGLVLLTVWGRRRR